MYRTVRNPGDLAPDVYRTVRNPADLAPDQGWTHQKGYSLSLLKNLWDLRDSNGICIAVDWNMRIPF